MISRSVLTIVVLLGLASAAIAGDTDWLRSVYGKPAVTRGEVLIAAALFADDAHWTADAGAALKLLEARRVVDAREAGDLARTATRGFGCTVFSRALKIRGGVMMRITGESGRYAYRELVLHGMIPDGPSHLALTGDELAGLLTGASHYQETGAVRPPGM